MEQKKPRLLRMTLKGGEARVFLCDVTALAQKARELHHASNTCSAAMGRMLAAAAIMGDEGRFMTLVKPQFEAGRGQVGKNGVVRDERVHRRVLEQVRDYAAEIGWHVEQFTYSPIKGPKGNIEFLADIRPGEGEMPTDEEMQDKLDRYTAQAERITSMIIRNITW